MKTFDSIITIGDSWSWGCELPEDQRISHRFDTLLSNKLDLKCINLSREGASNFCYKWHWINWLNSNHASIGCPLVVVGITGPNRHLLYNNQADYFQESPDRLISENMVRQNWGNNPGAGGFVRAFPNHLDFPNPVKKQIQKNFYTYNYDDKMAEIYSLWEIKLLDMLIKESGGYPIFWSNFHNYEQIKLPWAKMLLEGCDIVNHLQPLATDKKYFLGTATHPNAQGHAYIMEVLDNFISD
jgi:hypothetical protein